MESEARKPRTVLRTTQAISFAALAVFVAHALLGLGGRASDSFFNDWVYNGLVLVSAVSCLVRAARVRDRRTGWLLLGIGLLCWTASEVYSSAYLAHLKDPPYPSLSDVLALLFYPAGCAALILLVRGRMRGARASLWLDGLVAALAVCTIGEVAVFHQVLAGGGGGAETSLQVATDLAYPVADIITMALVASVFALTAWRPGRAWTMIGAGLGLAAIADSIFALQNAAGTYTVGGVLDALWPAATLLIGFAAWERSDGRPELELEGWRILVLPAAFALPALGFLVFDHYGQVDGAAVVLAALTLAAVIVRTAMTFGENMRMLRQSRQDALTDALTGLGNRRRLMTEMHEALTGPDRRAMRALVLFDLDGFKRYNDDFGHPAGDALLARFGASLIEVVSPGRAYRLGGDEFCALVKTDAPGAGRLVAAATAALSAEGRGFVVTASHGLVLMPDEAADANMAIHIADQRLYGHKHSRQTTAATQQARDVLMKALQERQPELHDHLRDVSRLALGVGRRMSLEPDELTELVRAAELHDVGKMAVPDQILDKPGSLDPAELSFIRQHTIVGERILAAAPALASVAPIVRSSHENWDGSGYPDGLAGEEIPLAARIIAACDAYHAMTTDRPYQAAVTPQQALAELRRCAGTKFSPQVVEILSAEVMSGNAAKDAEGLDFDLPTIVLPPGQISDAK